MDILAGRILSMHVSSDLFKLLLVVCIVQNHVIDGQCRDTLGPQSAGLAPSPPLHAFRPLLLFSPFFPLSLPLAPSLFLVGSRDLSPGPHA